jgi:hypothetical protein
MTTEALAFTAGSRSTARGNAASAARRAVTVSGMNVGANRGPLGDGLLDKGRWLFHYTTAERAFEKILLTRRLRMSPYRAMRDPLENKDLHLTFAGRVGESDEDSADFERAAFEALGMIKTIRDAVRLLSFTVDTEKWETPWGSGWARPRMWEQYADNHAGVCLVFDKTDAIDTFRAQMNRIPGTTKVRSPRGERRRRRGRTDRRRPARDRGRPNRGARPPLRRGE